MTARPNTARLAQRATLDEETSRDVSSSQVDAGKAFTADSTSGRANGDRLWLAAIVVAAVAVRMLGFHQPLVGNFATKHCVYAMTARNWALDRAPWWRPTLDCLADGERAWHLMEWPASAYLAAMGQRYCGGSLDAWGRGVGIACSAAAVALAFLLARRWFGFAAARATAVVVAFAPASIVYGRGFMLEPSLVALSFGAILAFDIGLRRRRYAALALSAVCMLPAILTKIYMVLLFLPLTAIFLRYGTRDASDGAPPTRRLTIVTFALFVLALSPAAWWYLHVAGIPSTTGPASEFHPLSRAGVQAFPNPLLFRPSYYLAVARDLTLLSLTPLGVVLLFVGLRDERSRRLRPWFAIVGLLVILLPLKFYFANYYQLVLLPPLALAVGVGWQRIDERFAPSRTITSILLAASLLIAARFTVGSAYRIPAEDRGVTEAAEVLRSLAGPDEPVATLHGSTLDLLYYCDRTGWALDANDRRIVERLDEATRRGAKHFVVVGETTALRNDSLTKWRSTRGPVRRGDDWAIYRLDPPQTVAEKSSTTATR